MTPGASAGPQVQEFLEGSGVAAARSLPIHAQHFDGTRAALAVAKGEAGSGQFTFRSPGRAAKVQERFPFAKGAVVIAMAYPRACYGQGELEVASYARERSYDRLAEVLHGVVGILRRCGLRGTAVADSNAAFDKGLARQARLGWVGKHSLVMVPGVGATVVLGSVMTSELINVSIGKPPHGNPCKNCRRCIEACPVDAIVSDGVIDVKKCLATVLQAPSLGRVKRASLGTRVYGCDACLSACPLGSRNCVNVVGLNASEVLESSGEDVLSRFSTWYIPSHDPAVVWRNILVARANARRSLTLDEARAVGRLMLSQDSRLSREALRCVVMSRVKGSRWSTSLLPTTSLPRSGGSSLTSTRSIKGRLATPPSWSQHSTRGHASST